MSEGTSRRLSENDSGETPEEDVPKPAPADDQRPSQDVQQHHRQETPARSKYEFFTCVLCYSKMFIMRLGKDLYHSALGYISERNQPSHIADLMRAHQRLQNERAAWIRAQGSIGNSREDDIRLQCRYRKLPDNSVKDRESMFGIVESAISSFDSKELVTEKRIIKPNLMIPNYLNEYVMNNLPTTSKNVASSEVLQSPVIRKCDSGEELQMIEINLQSENDIPIGDSAKENDSIVISYLQNRDAFSELEGNVLANKKKQPLLESVSKLETILEGEPLAGCSSTSDELMKKGSDYKTKKKD